MKFILIILGYALPAILVTIIIELLNKHKIIDTTINYIKKFDSKNSGPIYDFLKNTTTLIFMISGILLFLFSFSIGLIGGVEISNLLVNFNYLDALLLIILNTLTDIVLFKFMDKS